MLQVNEISVHGFDAAIRGARNPLNSWAKSDTNILPFDSTVEIGQTDLDLLKRLIKGGPDERKFMRMITVWMDVTAPLYWWKEADTYKVGTVANSCSTMHTLHRRDLTLSDFSLEHVGGTGVSIMQMLVDHINSHRRMFVEDKRKDDWYEMIQMLPSSFNQRRTWMLNYEVLRNIYHHRKTHKLDEWRCFCQVIESLPYSELITEVV